MVLEKWIGDSHAQPHVASCSYSLEHKSSTKVPQCTKNLGNNLYRFEGAIPCDKTGQQGFMVRAIPSHRDLSSKHEMRLIAWA